MLTRRKVNQGHFISSDVDLAATPDAFRSLNYAALVGPSVTIKEPPPSLRGNAAVRVVMSHSLLPPSP